MEVAMAGVKYNYALDEQGRLVSIKQAYLEKNEGHTYRCIGCGAGMIARLGEVRDWHFLPCRRLPGCKVLRYGNLPFCKGGAMPQL